MNKRIEALTESLKALESEHSAKSERLRESLQSAWDEVFNDSGKLRKAIENAEQANEYQFNAYGEIESWYRFADLSDFAECREYFEAWLGETHCMTVDWNNDCLLYSQGDDNLIIQDDTRYGRDNGVWLNGECVIPESDYKTEDGEVDTVKRNALIEAHMERTGHFPGVFRADQHGNVFHVNTKA